MLRPQLPNHLVHHCGRAEGDFHDTASLKSLCGASATAVTDEAVSAAQPLRVMVIDDHRSVAESIAMAIDLQPDMTCVGIAGSLAESRTLLLTGTPDVVLTDVRLPDGDGVEGARVLMELLPGVRILVLTAHADVEVMARAALIGACGFLPKESSIKAVLGALRRAREGGMTVEGSALSAVLGRVQNAPKPRSSAGANELTDREREVLLGLSQGLDPQAIARKLGISIHTCRGHVKGILSKLEAHSQLEAVVKAMHQGLLPGLSAG
jgi:DNA-binding NarL/FixJ family response regulator